MYQYFKEKPIHFYKGETKGNFEVQSSTVAAIRKKRARIIFSNLWFFSFPDISQCALPGLVKISITILYIFFNWALLKVSIKTIFE